MHERMKKRIRARVIGGIIGRKIRSRISQNALQFVQWSCSQARRRANASLEEGASVDGGETLNLQERQQRCFIGVANACACILTQNRLVDPIQASHEVGDHGGEGDSIRVERLQSSAIQMKPLSDLIHRNIIHDFKQHERLPEAMIDVQRGRVILNAIKSRRGARKRKGRIEGRRKRGR